MDCLIQEGVGVSIEEVHKLNIIRLWIEGFVDDSALFDNLPCVSDDVDRLISNLEHDMTWADLLQATGGQLELSTCFYYILAW
jgi:hypothetical protein